MAECSQATRQCRGRKHSRSSTADIRNLVSRNTTVVNAGVMFVSAGFIDTHCHPSGVNELYGVNTDLRTIREIKEALRKKAAGNSSGILGHRLQVRRHETGGTPAAECKDLDEVSKDHPVPVAHRGGHTTWY